MMRVFSLLLLAALLGGCRAQDAVLPFDDRSEGATSICSSIWLEELGRPVDPEALAGCIQQSKAGKTARQIRQAVRDGAEATAHRDAPKPASGLPPLPTKEAFYRNYQGNFGGIAVPGCGLRNDILFDPQLLPMFLHDKPCFERSLAAHAGRNDNRVVVSPAICYHEGYAGQCADVWHQPLVFRAFLSAIRSHTNAAGEVIEPLVIFVQGEHADWYPLIEDVGVPDAEKEAHVMRDLQAMAPAIVDLVAGTAPAWEPRPQHDWMTAGQFERIAAQVAALFPNAMHGIHLTKESSSWSFWPCDPERDEGCDPSSAEGDDPNRGDKVRAWQRCRAAGWCDVLLYQFPDGRKWLSPVDGDAGRDWKDRAKEMAERLPPGGLWRVDVPILWFEAIYDRFNGRATEALLNARCREAQAIHAAPCASASIRMP